MVTRTYGCPSCDARFRVFGMGMNDPPPPCPKCHWQESEWVPEAIAIAGSHSKAVDLSQKIIEKEYGLTNWGDRLREGDPAVTLTARQAPHADTFWGGTRDVAPATTASFTPNAAAWARESRRQGVDPLAMMQNYARGKSKTTNSNIGPGVIRHDLGVPKGDD